MITINNVDIFDVLCKVNCPVTVCGDASKINAVRNILMQCKIQIKNVITQFDDIYDVYYEMNEKFFVFVVPYNRADEKKWVALLEEMGLIKYKDFIVFQNNGNVSDWDAIDVNVGYTYKFTDMSYCQYGENEAEITVVTLGGSTTCSYEMWGVKCWPELLFEKLKGDGKSIRILNGAISGYNSFSELVKIMRDIDAIRPNIVISFSGLNDAVYNNLEYPFYTQHLKSIYDNFYKSVEKYCLPLTYGERNTKNSAELWVRNMRYMHEILKINGVDFVAFLQPFIVSDGYLMDYEETYTVNSDENVLFCLDLERDFLCKARSQIRNIEFIKDISQCFDNKKGLFRDQYHVYETGNLIIANAIYNNIIERLNYA